MNTLQQEQNEPQLSAEMEKRLEQLMTELLHADMPGLEKEDIPKSFRKQAEKTFRKRITPIIKHFLATALEKQKTEIVQKLENLDNKSVKFVNNTFRSGYQRSIKDVLTILNRKEV